MKRPLALVAFAFIVLFASCKKDSDGKPTENNDALVGNYKFKYITAHQLGITEAFGEKAGILNDFTTIDNAGTVKFTSSNMEATGLSYSTDSEGMYYTYDGNDIIDSFSIPNVWQVPPTNLTAPYQLIGTDSIYFPQGSFATSSPGTQTGGAGGGRYSWSGNLLTISQHMNVDTTFIESGEVVHEYGHGIVNIVFEKQ